MPRSPSPSSRRSPAVELRSGTYPLLCLRLHSLDPAALESAVSAKIAQAPNFFDGAAVVIEPCLERPAEGAALAPLVDLLRAHKLSVAGLRSDDPQLRSAAARAGLALLPAAAKGAESAPAARAPAKVIERPVRSGQQVYAAGTDLVLLAPVSAGAEVLADGSIYAYAPLRGRALAGLSGLPGACIVCPALEAELVSIAGHYRVLEELPGAGPGPVRVYLREDDLVIDPEPGAAPPRQPARTQGPAARRGR